MAWESPRKWGCGRLRLFRSWRWESPCAVVMCGVAMIAPLFVCHLFPLRIAAAAGQGRGLHALPCPALMANRRCKWVVEVHAVHVSEEADARMSASSFLTLSVSVPHPQQATGPRPYVPPAFSLAASIYIILFYTY